MTTFDATARHERLRTALGGVAAVTVAPFTRDGRELEPDMVASHAALLAASGIGLLVPGGNTGEYQSLSRTEWETIVLDTIAGAAGTPVMTGLGGPVGDVVDAARFAEEAGAHGIMVLPPHHTYQSRAGIIRYHAAILDAVEIGVVAYIRRPLDEAVLELAGHRNFVGVKFGLPDVARFATLREAPGAERLVWSCGLAETWAPFFMFAGATGFTSGIANVVPMLSLALHRAAAAGSWPMALELRRSCVPFEELRARHDNGNNVPVVKEALDRLDRYGGPVRPPLAPINEADSRALTTALDRLLNAAAGEVQPSPLS